MIQTTSYPCYIAIELHIIIDGPVSWITSFVYLLLTYYHKPYAFRISFQNNSLILVILGDHIKWNTKKKYFTHFLGSSGTKSIVFIIEACIFFQNDVRCGGRVFLTNILNA